MTDRDVLITGIGLVTPIGSGSGRVWDALLRGESGIGHIVPYGEEPGQGSWIGAASELPGPDEAGDDRLARRMLRLDRFTRFALAAAELAVRDAGLTIGEKDRAGVVIGTGFGGIDSLVGAERTRLTRGPRRVSPFVFPAIMANSAPAVLSIRYGLRVESQAVMEDALSGSHALARARAIMQHQDADVMLAGGAEAPLTPLVLAGLRPFGLLPHGHRDVAHAVRPFSRRREGFALGEGAAILVLETRAHAAARGALAYAELAGAGAGMGDGNHSQAMITAMSAAMADAGLDASHIDHINADGLATQAADSAETLAIEAVFGTYARHLGVSATKAATGHLWGGAGALEASLTALALHHQTFPPTLNWEAGDNTARLDYVPRMARAGRIRAALTNSRGLGQRAVSLAMKAP
jgi:3-oxoacyl-[acyl-carrier-protein] synthase II